MLELQQECEGECLRSSVLRVEWIDTLRGEDRPWNGSIRRPPRGVLTLGCHSPHIRRHITAYHPHLGAMCDTTK